MHAAAQGVPLLALRGKPCGLGPPASPENLPRRDLSFLELKWREISLRKVVCEQAGGKKSMPPLSWIWVGWIWPGVDSANPTCVKKTWDIHLVGYPVAFQRTSETEKTYILTFFLTSFHVLLKIVFPTSPECKHFTPLVGSLENRLQKLPSATGLRQFGYLPASSPSKLQSMS